MAFEIEFAESVEEHLEFVTTAERSRVLDAIDRQLKDSPLIETRNRKPLRPNPVVLRIAGREIQL